MRWGKALIIGALLWASAADASVALAQTRVVEISEEELAQHKVELDDFVAIQTQIEENLKALDSAQKADDPALDFLLQHVDAIDPQQFERLIPSIVATGRYEEARTWYARGIVRINVYFELIPPDFYSFPFSVISENYQFAALSDPAFAEFLQGDPSAFQRALEDALVWEEATPLNYVEPRDPIFPDITPGPPAMEDLARAREAVRVAVAAAAEANE